MMKEPGPAHRAELLQTLRERFERNRGRHPGVEWTVIAARLEGLPAKLHALLEMEGSGGEPDVVDLGGGELGFVDCSAESPAGRRSLCYDREGLESRKSHRPAGSAVETAAAMGIELLTEAHYRRLQGLGEFDLRTSSWVLTPPDIRALGGALFCDRRFGHVFTYPNGASSYYGSRGFRGLLRL